jgi:hypothetical protein
MANNTSIFNRISTRRSDHRIDNQIDNKSHKFQRSITMNAIQRNRHIQFINSSLSTSTCTSVVASPPSVQILFVPACVSSQEPTTYDRLFGCTHRINSNAVRNSGALYSQPHVSSLNGSTTADSSSKESISTGNNIETDKQKKNYSIYGDEHSPSPILHQNCMMNNPATTRVRVIPFKALHFKR